MDARTYLAEIRAEQRRARAASTRAVAILTMIAAIAVVLAICVWGPGR